jgi:hypothetical protein
VKFNIGLPFRKDSVIWTSYELDNQETWLQYRKLQMLFLLRTGRAHTFSLPLCIGASLLRATQTWRKARPDVPGENFRWGVRFIAPVQSGPGVHAASYKMGTGSFPGVKRMGSGVDHSPPASAVDKERVATTYFSCSPPDLNSVVTDFMFCVHVK